MQGYHDQYQKLKKRLGGKDVSVVGLGKSNIPLIRFLLELGCQVKARDKKDATQLSQVIDLYKGDDLQFQLGREYLKDLKEEVLFLTPGMPKDLPEIRNAVDEGSVIASEMGLFLELCQGKTIGITGSVGKTTTTSITGEIFLESGKPTYVGGNIGTPLLDKAEQISPDSYVILELSSFQLEMLKVSTSISAVLNIFPNHLDQHRSMDDYIEAKKNIFRYQNHGDVLILNADNDITVQMSKEAKGKVILFSVTKEITDSDSIFLKGDQIILHLNGQFEEICRLDDIVLPGKHNVGNYMVASAIARLCAIDHQFIKKVAARFAGIEHRISFIRELRGIKFYNDSKATTPESTISALRAFEQPIILIAGGYDKHVSFSDMAQEIVKKVEKLILVGVTADQIEGEVREAMKGAPHQPEIIRCSSFEEAVAVSAVSKPGRVVLLSPACASYDMFNNFEERGHEFTRLVRNLT